MILYIIYYIYIIYIYVYNIYGITTYVACQLNLNFSTVITVISVMFVIAARHQQTSPFPLSNILFPSF